MLKDKMEVGILFVAAVATAIALTAAVALVPILLLRWGWNMFAPGFGLPLISFWAAFGLVLVLGVVSSCLRKV